MSDPDEMTSETGSSHEERLDQLLGESATEKDPSSEGKESPTDEDENEDEAVPRSQMTARIPEALHHQLRVTSVKKDRPMQEIVAEAVADWLRREDEI